MCSDNRIQDVGVALAFVLAVSGCQWAGTPADHGRSSATEIARAPGKPPAAGQAHHRPSNDKAKPSATAAGGTGGELPRSGTRLPLSPARGAELPPGPPQPPRSELPDGPPKPHPPELPSRIPPKPAELPAP